MIFHTVVLCANLCPAFSAVFRGEFSRAQVEAMTERTRSFKTFGVLCAMLGRALAGGEGVFVDLLTRAEIERVRGGGGEGYVCRNRVKKSFHIEGGDNAEHGQKG
jgi:hypothetical protein